MGLPHPLLPTDGAPNWGLSRFSKQFQRETSAKFTVANDQSDASPSTPLQHGDTLLASIRSDLVPFVAPICIKGLRLVTVQLPKRSSPIGPGINRTSP
jgi:hypothetical protein